MADFFRVDYNGTASDTAAPLPSLIVRQREELGSGGEGAIVAGTLDGRPVAIKTTRQASREVDVLLATCMPPHPNVVKVIAFQQSPRSSTIVMPRYKCDLFSVLEGGALPEARCKEVMRGLLQALAWAHSHGVAHLDVKHENLFLKEDGGVVLGDWGFAKRAKPGLSPLVRGRIGSHYFRAPEAAKTNSVGQFIAFRGAPADVWSAGVVLSYCLVLFGVGVNMAGPTPVLVLPDESLMRRVSPAARAFLLDMLVIDPEERPTAAQLLQHPWLAEKAAEVLAPAAVPASTTPLLKLPPKAMTPTKFIRGPHAAATPNSTRSVLSFDTVAATPTTPASRVVVARPHPRPAQPTRPRSSALGRAWAFLLKKVCGGDSGPEDDEQPTSAPKPRAPRGRGRSESSISAANVVV